jgi:N-acetylmuramoyl-L-alanine amidase
MNYDLWLAAITIWREARGQSMAVKTAIWHVIQNRTRDEKRRWPRTISGVVLQHAQFSSMTVAGDPNLVAWPVQPIPGQAGSNDWQAWLDCQTVVESPLPADPTNGANMYESEPANSPPYWVKDATLTLDLINTRFYKLL